MEFEERNPIIESILNANERKDQQIAVLEKALELACDWFMTTGFLGDQIKTEFYINRAQKKLGDKK